MTTLRRVFTGTLLALVIALSLVASATNAYANSGSARPVPGFFEPTGVTWE
ncbi:MAG TPA: hypothetical protein VFC31_02840 [Candidatus Limnocylindria bacterium]|nr:hypothetical protein [Candidatus Limnocylindria bacterium]